MIEDGWNDYNTNYITSRRDLCQKILILFDFLFGLLRLMQSFFVDFHLATMVYLSSEGQDMAVGGGDRPGPRANIKWPVEITTHPMALLRA